MACRAYPIPQPKVATAIDGKNDINKLKADPGIRMILSDVNMPNTNVRGKAAGIKDRIVKPFTGPAALETLKKFAA